MRDLALCSLIWRASTPLLTRNCIIKQEAKKSAKTCNNSSAASGGLNVTAVSTSKLTSRDQSLHDLVNRPLWVADSVEHCHRQKAVVDMIIDTG
jgi:hypothetical protein